MEDGTVKENIVIPVEYFALFSHFIRLNSDEKEIEAFEKFSEARQSYGIVNFLLIFWLPLVPYAFIMALMHAKSWYFIAAIGIALVVIRNPIALLVWYVKNQIKNGVRTPFVDACAPWISCIVNMLSIFGCFFFGLFLIARTLNGKCSVLDQYHMYSCNSEYSSHALPQEHMVCLMMIPIVLSTVIKTIRTPYIALSWVFSVSCISISIGISNSYQSIPALVIYVPLSLAILVEAHRQNIILFLVLKKQQTLMNDIRVLSEEAQNELRFMIANMAHDLKTPLSSFMNGVETLSSLFHELKKTTKGEDRGLNSSIKENIKNLFNVNQFMTMTVNRCIDYMKASKGIKLEPRLETINLQEVLSMPLNCMRDLQSRIAIIQKPIPGSVCSHIITDLQWFQENLFCLISNAVKYSSHGHISVSLSLTSASDPRIASASAKKVLSSGTLSSGGGGSLDGYPSSPSGAHEHNEYRYLDKLPAVSLDRMKAPDFEVSSRASSRSSHSSFFSVASKCKVYVDLERASGMLNCEDDGIELSQADISAHHKVGSEELDKEFLIVEVEDTGIGLSDEVKETLFTPFKQAQRRAGGTGLGLYSLAKRVDALGGYYGVSNRRDGEQGSIFWFAVPYRPDDLMESVNKAIKFNESSRSEHHHHNHHHGQNHNLHVAVSANSYAGSASGGGATDGVVAGGGGSSLHGVTASNRSDVNRPLGSISELVGFGSEPPSPSGMMVLENFLSADEADAPVSVRTTLQLENHITVSKVEMPAAGKLRILLVDDSVTILKMTSNLLKRHGHVVDQEENGADALARLDKARGSDTVYDVMLIDLNMPVMDGLEATKRLREVEKQLKLSSNGARLYHQIVFAFSANSDNDTVLEAMEAGADDFVCKPFSIQTFNEKFGRLTGFINQMV